MPENMPNTMKEILQTAMKVALKAQDKVRLDTIRGLMSAIQYEQLQKNLSPLPESGCVEVFQREIKKRRESLDFAEKANRTDLVTRTKEEIAVIQEFLPKQLSAAELEKIIKQLKTENPELNMGGAMKILKEKHAGLYDGKMASELAKKLLMLALCIGLFTGWLITASNASASGFYVTPKTGLLVALDENDVDYTLGAAIGYRWVKLLAIEFDYTRVFASPNDNNLLGANVVISGLRGIFWSYALAGAGVAISTVSNADPEPIFRLGGGTMLNVLPWVRPFVQLTYLNLNGDNHFLEPQAGIYFGF